MNSSKLGLFKQLHRLRPGSMMTRCDQRHVRQVRLEVAHRKAGTRLQLFRLQSGLRPSLRMTERKKVKARQKRVQTAVQKPSPAVMREAQATVNSEIRVSETIRQMPQSWYDDMFRMLNSPIRVSSRDCGVCFERIGDDQLIRRTITSSCNHRSIVPICRHCLQQSISAQISSTAWEQIRYPVLNCNAILQYNDMQRLATTEAFLCYDKNSLKQAINADDTFRECAHPGCRSGGFCDPEVDSFVTCGACQGMTCIGCNVPYHMGESCGANQKKMRKLRQALEGRSAKARMKEVIKSQTYLRRYTQVCPNKKCGVSIEKDGGCDHMRYKHRFHLL